MDIIPAILTNNLDDFKQKLHTAEHFAKQVHIDFADGIFVANETLGPGNLNFSPTNIPWSFHLMVADPLKDLEKYLALSPTQIFIHAEIQNPEIVINKIIEYGGVEVGIALNPETSVDVITHYLDKIHSVLIMTVHPGFYGAKFLTEVLHKIDEVRQMKDGIIVGVDGGVNPETMKEIKENNPDFVMSGSFIFESAQDPKSQFNLLMSSLRA